MGYYKSKKNGAFPIVHKIDDNEVDIACVTETWLSDEVPHCVTDIDGYTCERRDRVDRRGGASLFTSVIAFHTTVYLFLNATRWSHYGYCRGISARRGIFLTFWSALCITPQALVNLFAPTTSFPLSTRS